MWCRKRPADPDWRPFCSERCKRLDLNHWLAGNYRVPGDPVDVEADADETATAELDRPPDRRT